MKTIKDQVTAALDKAEHGKRNSKLHPDDRAALSQMTAELTQKMAELDTQNNRIKMYLASLNGHYS